MAVLYVDVSMYDVDRRGGLLPDWAKVKTATSGVMCARATYGDPQGYHPETRHFRELQAGAEAAGFTARGGYANLIQGDQASINRQVDWLRAELDAASCQWGMVDVEPYKALLDNGLWPRTDDAQRWCDRWRQVETRPLLVYLPRWVWAGQLNSPDLRPLGFPLVASNYPKTAAAGPARMYAAAGGDTGPGWGFYGGVTPSVWQFTSSCPVPGLSTVTDVNAIRDAAVAAVLSGGAVTTAPPNLLAVRSLLMQHLKVPAAAMGIVGDSAHLGGYHCGKDRTVSGDYSVVQSTRDRNGLTSYASALDVGQFTVSIAGKRHDLRSFSIWCVAQCKANARDAEAIREIIYSGDGKSVKRWDRLGRSTSGDSSHLWHTHFSYHRDATKDGRDLRPLFTRYLTEIGLIAGSVTPAVTPDLEDNIMAMTPADRAKLVADIAEATAQKIANFQWPAPGSKEAPGPKVYSAVRDAASAATAGRDVATETKTVATGVKEEVAALHEDVTKALAAVTPPAGADPGTIAQGVIDAVPGDVARRVADEITARLHNPTEPQAAG